MRFSGLNVLFLSASAVSAIAIPAEANADLVTANAAAPEIITTTWEPKSVAAEEHSQLAERAGATAAIAGTVGSAAVDVAVGAAINFVNGVVNALVDWTKAREQFTQATTAEMWKRNPDPKVYKAAACYNKGYRVQNSANVGGKHKVTLRLNVLHTDYDCMYIKAPNQFYTDAEGGYINLSYTYDGKSCSFDQGTGDLSCN